MSFFEENNNKKKYLDKNNKIKLDIGDNKNRQYKIKTIDNSVIYTKNLASYLPEFYYLTFFEKLLWKKKYLEALFIDLMP